MLIDSALYLASLGFHVFPGEVVEIKGRLVKKPMFRGWQESATCDLEQIEGVWRRVPNALPCISTSWFTNGGLWHLLAIDVDNKENRGGSRSLVCLGDLCVTTFAQRTPTGGFHFIYKTRHQLANTSGKLGPGLDTRGWHGLVVGAGSSTPAGVYTIAVNAPVTEAPAGLVDLVGMADIRPPSGDQPIPEGVDREAARVWAIGHLQGLPVAMNGTIDDSAFAAAAALHTRGLGADDIHELMEEHFKSELPAGRLDDIARHAGKYAKGAPGSSAPEVIFEKHLKSEAPEEAPVMPTDGTPIEWFNRDHTVCLIGSACYVIKRSRDSWGAPILDIMGTDAFHTLYAGCTFTTGEGKQIPISRAWMSSKYRSTHFGLAFAPGRELPPTHYNLWQGFSYEPQQVGSGRAHRALAGVKHHILHNMCHGDKERAHYVTSWFAQMYQKPQEKAVVSLVIRGEKGSGKDTLLDILGAPLGPHYMLTAQGSDLTGQFNSGLESRLLIVYNEAFWAHDHKAEAVLKQLVTGRKIRIERKGCEPYWVDNLSRTVIMGNDNVQVPASIKERRWFVIDMRDIPEKEQASHIAFCTELREGMEAGGYPLLVDYLLNYDISGVNLKIAPNSQGLVEQKEASLPAVQLWFRECLGIGAITGCGVPLGWPERIEKETFRQAFRRWADDNGIKGRVPTTNMFGRLINEMEMGIDGTQKLPSKDGRHQVNVYVLPPLAEARKKWDIFIKAVKETRW